MLSHDDSMSWGDGGRAGGVGEDEGWLHRGDQWYSDHSSNVFRVFLKLRVTWCIYVMEVVNAVMLYLVITSDTTNEFLPGDNQHLLK